MGYTGFSVSAGSAQRLDVGDEIRDFGPCQRQIGHRSVRLRQECAQPRGRDIAARERRESRRPGLGTGRRGAADDMAIGAPDLGQTLAMFEIGGARPLRRQQDGERQQRRPVNADYCCSG
jgi:hypothetical protein